jgi:predicted nucleic-acid-binding protein
VIALDTNLLVRLFVRDQPSQVAIVEDLVRDLTPDRPGFLGREVLVELVWVLERSYRFERVRVADLVAELLDLGNLVVETAEDVSEVVALYREGAADFADLMILAAARRAGASLFTFDRKLAGQSGATLVDGA